MCNDEVKDIDNNTIFSDKNFSPQCRENFYTNILKEIFIYNFTKFKFATTCG